MTVVFTVLKTGLWNGGYFPSDYKPEHVQWLAKQVKVHTPNCEFVCLSDVEIPGVKVIPLKYNWPGWWSKMELFREDFGQVFYIDLDTVVVGDLTPLLNHKHKFTAWSAPRKVHHLQSSVMAWTGYKAQIFEPFKIDADYWIKECVTASCWGDQGFIGKQLNSNWDEFNILFPKAIGSFKLDFHQKEPPLDCKIVSFHGKPKPWEVHNKHKFIPVFGA